MAKWFVVDANGEKVRVTALGDISKEDAKAGLLSEWNKCRFDKQERDSFYAICAESIANGDPDFNNVSDVLTLEEVGGSL